jgi:hypothetical protein
MCALRPVLSSAKCLVGAERLLRRRVQSLHAYPEGPSGSNPYVDVGSRVDCNKMRPASCGRSGCGARRLVESWPCSRSLGWDIS